MSVAKPSTPFFPRVNFWEAGKTLETVAYGRSPDGRSLLVAVPNQGTTPPYRLLPYCAIHQLVWAEGEKCPLCDEAA